MIGSNGNIFLGGWREYIKKIVSMRFFATIVLVIALVCAMSAGYDRFMIEKQEWITPWMAPHFFQYFLFAAFYGFVVCYMYSDVPFMNRGELYGVLRKGRRIWCAEKIFAIIMQAFTLTIVTFIASAVVFIPRLQIETGWGKVINTLAYSSSRFDYDIITPSAFIIEKYSPLQAMLICFVIVWLVSSVIGLLMFCISLYWNRVAAIAIAVIDAGFTMSQSAWLPLYWLPYVALFNWCRIGTAGEAIGNGHFYPSTYVCIGICCVLFICGVIAIMIRAKRIEFNWNKED